MTIAGAIRAGRAFFELSLGGPFEKQLGQFRRQVQSLEKLGGNIQAIGGFVSGVGRQLTGLSAALAAPLALTIKGAADAEEALSRFEAVFKSQAVAAAAFADQLGASVGRSSLTIKDNLATFQSFFVGLGFDPQQARQFSQQLESLALDFASFNNLADDEAVGRFISALSGSSEVVDRFGINLKVAALDQELLAQGFPKVADGATEQQKAIARLAIITRAMTQQGAVGDALRTAGSFTNQLKATRATIQDLGIEIGRALLPPLTRFLHQAREVIRPLREWVINNNEAILTFGKMVLVLGSVGVALTAAGKIVAVFGTAISAMAATVTTALTVISAPVVGPIAVVVGALLWWASQMPQVRSAVVDGFDAMREAAQIGSAGIVDALKSGDLEGAVTIATETIKTIWKNALLDIQIAIHEFNRNAIEQVTFFPRAFGRLSPLGFVLSEADRNIARLQGERDNNIRELADLIKRDQTERNTERTANATEAMLRQSRGGGGLLVTP